MHGAGGYVRFQRTKNKLKCRTSPQQISCVGRRKFPARTTLRQGHNTVYCLGVYRLSEKTDRWTAEPGAVKIRNCPFATPAEIKVDRPVFEAADTPDTPILEAADTPAVEAADTPAVVAAETPDVVAAETPAVVTAETLDALEAATPAVEEDTPTGDEAVTPTAKGNVAVDIAVTRFRSTVTRLAARLLKRRRYAATESPVSFAVGALGF